MNFVTALRFVHEHNDKVLAVLIALFLLTAIFLLLRSIGKGNEHASAGAAGEVVIDAGTIEAAMRKVLGDKVLQPSGNSSAAAVPEVTPINVSSASSVELANAVAEREKQIEVLQIAVREAREQAAQALAAAANSGSGDASSGAEAALKDRVDELEAKLSEYEIITDDIADLSLFKDENSRMKVELEQLRSDLAATAAAMADSAVAAAKAAETAQPAKVSRIATEQEAELRFEKAEKFELDINDDVMKAFAAAVDSGKVEGAPVSYSLPAEEVEPEVRQALEATINLNPRPSATVALDPQAAIDAMMAAASAEASAPAAEPALDPQAAIDAMMAAAGAEASAPAAEPALDPQAAIDAMMAAASAESSAPAVEPALDPQAMIDAMLKQAETVTPVSDAADSIAAAPVNSSDLGALSLDALKMISEVEKLTDHVADVAADAHADALLETLDTEKLLSEASNLSNDQSLESTAQDDLFAEFKDEKGNES